MADQTIPTIKNLRGNIGIGTASPSQKLHVVGTNIRLDSNAGGFYKYTDGGAFRFALYDDASKTHLYADGDGVNPHMTFNGGLVGIGTASPTSLLNLNDASNNQTHQLGFSYLHGGTKYDPFTIGRNSSTGNLEFHSDINNHGFEFKHNAAGEQEFNILNMNVGIGTVSPAALLDIVDSQEQLGLAGIATIKSTATTTATSTQSSGMYKIQNYFNLTGTGGSFQNAAHQQVMTTVSSTGTSTQLKNHLSRVHTSGSGQISNVTHYNIHAELDGNGTIAKWMGYAVADGALSSFTNTGHTITNTYGLYIGDLTSGTQTNTPFGVYQLNTDMRNYFGGSVGIGTTNPSRNDYSTVDPKLHVKQAGTNGAYNLVARFEAGGDANNTGSSILINHSNDRGLLIEAGREIGDLGIAHLGILNSAGSNSRILTLKQGGKVGINDSTPAHILSVTGSSTLTAAVTKITRVQASASNDTYTLEVDSSAHTSNMTLGGAFGVKVNSGKAFKIDGFGAVHQNYINYTDEANYEALKISAESDHIKYDTKSIGTFVSNVRGYRFHTNGTKVVTIDSAGGGLFSHMNIYIDGTGALRNLGNNLLLTTSTQTNNDIIFKPNNTEAVWIKGDGKVGIGATIPTKALDVRTEARVWNGTNGVELTYSTGNTSAIFGSANTSGNIEFRTNTGSTAKMWIANAGNVGIGNNVPSYKLDVSGTIRTTDYFRTEGHFSAKANLIKTFSLVNIAAATTHALGTLTFGNVYTHGFRVTVMSYGGCRVFEYLGYQGNLHKKSWGSRNQHQAKFEAIDVVAEETLDNSGQMTAVTIGVRNTHATDVNYIFSAKVECFSSGDHSWADVSSTTSITDNADNQPTNPRQFFHDIIVGKDDTGHDVTFYGDTASRYLKWDASDDALELTDAAKLKFGDDVDLTIYHESGNNWIASANGRNLMIQSNGLALRSEAQENYLVGTANGAVDLYYNNSKKFETTNGGVSITGAIDATGVITADGGLVLNDNDEIKLGTGADFKIYHKSSNNISFIENTNAAGLRLLSDEFRVFALNGTAIRAHFGTNVELYYSDSKKFETTSTGVAITGGITTTTASTFGGDATFAGDVAIQGDLSVVGDFTIIHTDTSTTEQMSITNDGTGPALIVNQLGAQPLVDFKDDSSSVFYIANHGNVVIGGSSPTLIGGTAKLTINVGATTNVPVTIANGTTDQVYFRRYTSGGKYQIQTVNGSSNAGALSLQSYGGNVGIGTLSPATKLDVAGDINILDGFYLKYNNSLNLSILGSSSTGTTYTSLKHHFKAYDGSVSYSEYMTIDTGGNVGIGTTSPAAELDLRGDMRLDGSATDRSIYFRNQNAIAKVRSDAALQFDVGVNSSPSVAMYIQEETRYVGIGTVSPAFQLDVQTSVGALMARFKDSDSSHDGFRIEGDNNGAIICNDSALSSEAIYFQNSINVMRFYAAGAEKMRLTSEALELKGSQDADDPRIHFQASDASNRFSIETDLDSTTTNDLLGFVANHGTSYKKDILFLKANGNVGIGTTNPLSTLHIATNDATNGDLMIGGNNDPMGFACEFVGNNDTKLHIGRKHSADSEFIERVTIIDEGKVGIGTTSPNEALEVKGSIRIDNGASFTAYQVYRDNILYGSVGGGGNQFTIQASNNKNINLFDDSGTGITIKDGGNVGIGVTSPSQKLDVDGIVVAARFIQDTNVGSDFYAVTTTRSSSGLTSPDVYDKNGNGLVLGGASGEGTLVVKAGGNVGIGTTAPVNKLQVNYSPATAIGSLTATAGTASTNWNRNAGLLISGASVSNGLALGTSGTANDRKAWIQAGHPDSAANSLGTISLNPLGGHVGIGTTNPVEALNIGNNGNIRIDGNASGRGIFASSNGSNNTFSFTRQDGVNTGDLSISGYGGVGITGGRTTSPATSGYDLYVVSGNVGIGTTSPDAWLEISKDNNNSGNQFCVADIEGGTAAIRTYATTDPQGLILNHYYAEGGSGNEYMRYADFVSNVGNGAGTTMRFITKNAANTYSATVIDNEGNLTVAGSLTVSSDLIISGTTTTIDTANLLVEDKNIILGNVTTPSDTTADGGGITLKGASDYTINWTNSTNSWNFNQGLDVTGDIKLSGNLRVGDGTRIYLWNANNSNYLDYANWVASTGSQQTIINTGAGGIHLKASGTDADIIFSASDGTLNELMRLDGSTSRVGIGTTTPQHELDVDGTIRHTSNIVSNAYYTAFTIGSDRTVDDYGGVNKDYWKLALRTPGSGTTGESSAHAYGDLVWSGVDGVDATFHERMVLRANGKLGLGVSEPATSLHIVDSSGPTIRFERSSSSKLDFTFGSSNTSIIGAGEIQFRANGGTSNKLVINNSLITASATTYINASLGVGVASPESTVHIQNTVAAGSDNFALHLHNPTDASDSRVGMMFRVNNNTGSSIDGAAIQAMNNGVDGQAHLGLGHILNGTFSETLRIDTSNRVGIGVTNPDCILEVKGAGTGSTVALRVRNSSDTELLRVQDDGASTFSGAITATGGNSTNWNTAYGWGNHASAGYASSNHTHTFASLTSKPTTLSGYGITNGINSTEPNEPFNPFAGQKFHDGVLTNALVGRHDRFVVTIDGTTEAGASWKLANQNFEEYNQNRLFGTSAGETKVFNINVQSLATGSANSNGITYCAGFFDINFYSSPFPASWSARCKKNDGTWTTVSSLTKIGNSKLRGVIPFSNYLTDIEFTLVARTSAPFVTGNITYGISEFELFFSRMAASQGGNISSIGGYLGGTITTASGTTSTNWNTAYGWGDHASAGYAPLASPTFTGAVTLSGSIQNSDQATSIDLKDHSNYTWFRNAANRWVFQGGTSGDDWTQHFALCLETVGTGYNDKYARLGQQQNNGSNGGRYKGVRIVKSTGSSSVVDGELKAGDGVFSGSVTGSNLNISNWNTAHGWGNHASAGYASSQIPINAETASYTLVLADQGGLVEVTHTSDRTVTIPPNSSVAYAVGTQIIVQRNGTGAVTIVAGSGVTAQSANSQLKIRARYGACVLIKKASDTWAVIGDMDS